MPTSEYWEMKRAMKSASDQSISPRRVAAMSVLLNSDVSSDLRLLIQTLMIKGAIRVGVNPSRWIALGLYGMPVVYMRGAIMGWSGDDIVMAKLRLRHCELYEKHTKQNTSTVRR